MKITYAALAILLLLHPISVQSTTIIMDCPIQGKTMEDLYRKSSGILVATPIAVSVRPTKDSPYGRRTILWRSNESWSGPYKGSTFTTREIIQCDLRSKECRMFGDWAITKGRPMLLFLAGKEPYKLGSRGCTPTDFLEDSIFTLEKLFKLRLSWQHGT